MPDEERAVEVHRRIAGRRAEHEENGAEGSRQCGADESLGNELDEEAPAVAPRVRHH